MKFILDKNMKLVDLKHNADNLDELWEGMKPPNDNGKLKKSPDVWTQPRYPGAPPWDKITVKRRD